MFQPLSPFSSRAKVMVQLDKTPYHSIIVGLHTLLSNPSNISSANIETPKLSTYARLVWLKVCLILLWKDASEWTRWDLISSWTRQNVFWQWLSKFSHSFVKVVVISHKKPIPAEIMASKFKNLSQTPLKNVIFEGKKWCLTTEKTHFVSNSFRWTRFSSDWSTYKDEENMVICLTCFQLFRCTVLILPQKLVNKLKKPKMTKLSMDKSLYFTRRTKRENYHKYFKKKKTSWKFCCWKGSDCGQPPVNSN